MKTKLIMLLLIPLYLSACASAPQTKNEEVANAGQPGKREAQVEKAAVSTVADIDQNTLVSQRIEMQLKSVYFDFDRYEIKPEYKEVIRQHSDSIKAGTGTVTLQGNADERGSSEYNLALGNKRANVVRKALELSGVKSTQIDVVSFGEEIPRLSCHEEKCWAENRRVDFIAGSGK